MSSEMIRVGVVGAGANTVSKHIPGLQAIQGVEIVSVCNRSRASSKRVAQQVGIPTIYDNWKELIDAPDTNAIVIGTWPYMHCRTVLEALAMNKNVMCEARMAANAAEAIAMRDAARMKPGLVAQIVPSPFSLRVDSTIKRLIGAGYLGDLLAIEVRDGNTFLDPDAPLHWRQDFDLSGVNILSLGIWYEAIMRWVGDATNVMAKGKTFVNMRKDADGVMRAVRVPEYLNVIADMACGAQAHIRISSVTGFGGASEATLYGSKGTLRFTNNNLYGGQRDDSQLKEIPIPANEEGRWRVEEEFVNAIRGLEPLTHTTFETGTKYMAFTEAVNRSMATGKAVPLPLELGS